MLNNFLNLVKYKESINGELDGMEKPVELVTLRTQENTVLSAKMFGIYFRTK